MAKCTVLVITAVTKYRRGGSMGGLPLIFRPNWGPKGRKKNFWDRPQPPFLSQGLDERLDNRDLSGG